MNEWDNVRYCDECENIACEKCTVIPSRETGLFHSKKYEYISVLCLNCIRPIYEGNFDKIAERECGELFNMDIIRIIYQYAKGYAFECCYPKCHNIIEIEDDTGFKSGIDKNGGRFCYYLLDDGAVIDEAIERQCRYIDVYNKWMRIFCESCTKWNKEDNWPDGLNVSCKHCGDFPNVSCKDPDCAIQSE